jgi:DNA-binding NarL/FixJ family response regulator
MKKIKILLLDDNPSLLNALRIFLKVELNCEVFGGTTENLFSEIESAEEIDIILIATKISDSDEMNAEKYFEAFPNAKLIAISMFSDSSYCDMLIRTGFKGCITKENIWIEVSAAIKAVLNGEIYLEKALTKEKN